MKPGWYSYVQHRDIAAYFDGGTWGPATDVRTLDPEIRSTISVLLDSPPTYHRPTVPSAKTAYAQPTRNGAIGWYWGIAAGVIVILGGLVRGFSVAGANCGAPFEDSMVAEYLDAMAYDKGYGYTGFAAQCREDLAGATITTWILICLGVLVALASALIMATIRSGHARATGSTEQTLASRIEDLARLRDQGLVSTEEYEWKRQEMLRR